MQIFTPKYVKLPTASLKHNLLNLMTAFFLKRKISTEPDENRIFSFLFVRRTFILLLVCVFMSFTGSVMAQADFTVTPPTRTATIGDVFTLTVVISTSEAANAGEVHMTFDETILNVNSITPTGPFNFTVAQSVDNVNGTVDYISGTIATPVDGTFDFLLIEVEAIANGVAEVDFNGVDPSKITSGVNPGTLILDSATGATITVGSVNQPPIFDNNIADQINSEQDVVSLDVSATDPNSDFIIYEALNLPGGLNIDANGLISGTIQLGASTGGLSNLGIYDVMVTASDDGTPSSSTPLNFQWTVNTPIVITYNVTATAGANGSISPETATVNEGGSQLFTITPDNGFEVADVLVDGTSVGATTEYFLENVTANATISATFILSTIDTAPEITLAATAIVNEGGNISIPLSISDTDGDNLTVTYSSISNEPQLLQTNNSGKQVDPFPFDADGFFAQSNIASLAGSYSANLDFTPIFGDGGGSNGDGNGIYMITVTVTDEDENSISQDLVLTVNDIAQFVSETTITRIEAESFDNQGPENNGSGNNGIGVEIDPLGFTNIGFAHVGDFVEYEIDVETAGLYAFRMLVSDPGNTDIPTSKTMDITSSVGGSTTFTVIGTGDYANYVVQTINVNLQAGAQTLKFDWTGGSGFLFNIDYFDIEFLGAPNNSPTISSIANYTGNEGELISIPFTVTDDNDPSATIEIFDVSAGGTNNPFTPTTAVVVGTLVDNTGGSYTFNWTPATGTGRSYLARVIANDGVNDQVTQEFRIDVAQQLPGSIFARTFNNPIPWYGSSAPEATAGYTVAIEPNSANNIGYIDNGDFVEYLINVPTAGFYDVEIFAGKGTNGTTTLNILEQSGGSFASIGSVGISNTGWQTYVSYTTQVNFSNAGVQTLRFEFNGGANIRDFNFTLPSSNTPPIVSITSPEDNIVAESDYSINFASTANDTQDGDLSANINWTSNLDGLLGTGAVINTNLSVGTHIVTAEVEDADASPLTGSATRTLIIVSPSPVCDVEFRVNAGGPAVLSNSGTFEEDQALSSGNAGSSAEPGTPSAYVNLDSPAEDTTYGAIGALTNTTGYPDYLFQTERFSAAENPDNMNWSFPTGNGVFNVKILFNENWTGESGDPRVFDVEIEDELALGNYRPSGVSGVDVNVAKVESFEATVTDGVLNINFIKGTQNPSVKGFDICFVSDLPTDTPPVVTISSPTNNLTPISVDRMVETTFTASVEDAEDDNATLTDNLIWSINPFEPNFAGTGGSFEDTIFVPGVYTIRASSTDSDDNVAFDEIQVTVLGPDVEITAPEENAILTTTDVRVEWTATNLNYVGATPEHFHIWVNPEDPNNLIDGERVSTASAPGQLFWDLTATEDGIVEGLNRVIIIAADNGHAVFTNAEARDEVTFTVDLADNTVPIAVCRDIIVQLDETGNVSIAAADIDGGSTDNIAIDNISIDKSDFDVSNVGANTVTLRVEDASGNSSTCTATVTVQDNVPPIAICQNFSVELDANGAATISPADIDNGSSDAAGITLSLNRSDFNCDDIGTNTVTLTVTDTNGNVATCEATITVSDVTPPEIITCTSDIFITSSTSEALSLTPPTASDACGVKSVVGSRSDGLSLTDPYQEGTATTVLWTVTDNNNLVSTCQFQVIITAPALSGKDILGFDVSGQLGNEDIDPSLGTVELTVGAGTSVTALAPTIVISNAASISPISGTSRDFTTPQMYTVTAEDDTTKEWTVTVNVASDTEAPEVTCPTDITVANDIGECGAVVTFNATATDNLPGVTLGYSVASGSVFDVGTTTVVVTATDLAGLTATCSFDVTVTDSEAPVVSCPGDQTIEGNLAGNAALPDFTGLAVASDNCDPSLTVTQSPAPGTNVSGIITVTLTATDADLNSAQCTFETIIQPETLASLTITPSSVTVNLFQGETGMVNYVVDSDDASSLPTPAAMALIDNATNNPPTWASTTSAANQGTSYEVSFDATGLAPGTYTAILSAGPVSGYTNASIPITLTVNPIVSNSALQVLNATTDTPLFALTDGLQISKATIGNTPLGIVYNPSLNPGGVRFILTGPLSETRTEGATAPYSLFGDIGVDVQGKVFPVGNYTLVADPNVGPTITVNFSVTDVNPLCANFNASLTGIVNPSVCSGVGSATAVPSGGASPFTYQWDNGETTATANNLSVGPHSVVVRDANGCSKTLTLNLTGPPLPTVTLAPFASVLNTAPAFALTGGSPLGGTYSGPGVTGSTFNPAIGVGTYVITYSYTDINGCSNLTTRSITVTTETSNSALVVLDATTDAPLFALTDGLQISKATIGNTPLGIVYNASLNPNGVRFILTGPLSETRTEGSTAPYSLFGDIGVDVQGKVFPVGNYTLLAIPNSGTRQTINFSVVNSTPSNQSLIASKLQLNEMSISPNPANEEVTMSFDEPTLVEEILIFDVTGRLIKTVKEHLGLDSKSIEINVYDLPIGTYFIKTVDSKGIQHQQQMLIDRY
ncbi:MAG: HYR domain-containing protein [Maribacter sp.]